MYADYFVENKKEKRKMSGFAFFYIKILQKYDCTFTRQGCLGLDDFSN